MLIVAAMIVTWAMSPSKSSPVEPQNEQVVEILVVLRRCAPKSHR